MSFTLGPWNRSDDREDIASGRRGSAFRGPGRGENGLHLMTVPSVSIVPLAPEGSLTYGTLILLGVLFTVLGLLLAYRHWGSVGGRRTGAGGTTDPQAATLGSPSAVRASNAEWASETARRTAWAPVSVLAFYILAAVLFDLFQLIPRLDVPLHFAGGLAIAYSADSALKIGLKAGRIVDGSARRRSIVVIGATLAAALLWEALEFSSDRLLGTREQLGPTDTVRDILVGVLASVAFVALQSVLPHETT